jgi:hypothetical protein
MSYAMVVYSIPLGRMRSLLGSKDHEILDEVIEEHGDFFADLDEQFEDYFADEEPLTMEEAVAHLLDGGPYRAGAESLYLFAFEALCATIGRELDNLAFQPPIRWAWITEVDQRLESIGFPLRVATLATGGLPFDFPHTNDLPSVGHWTQEKFALARKCLTKDRLDADDSETGRRPLVTISGWLNVLAERKGDVLIGIYS